MWPSTTPAARCPPTRRPRPSWRCPEPLWRDPLCLQEERRVGNDNCVRWHGRSLQIPPTPLRPHLVRATVRVHAYPDGTLAIFNGPHRLASFPPAAPASYEALAA